jgi:hypothetical protein
MTTDDDSGPKPPDNPPVFLSGSRPSFLEIVSSRPPFLEQGAEEKEAEQPELEAVPPEARGGSRSDVVAERRGAQDEFVARGHGPDLAGAQQDRSRLRQLGRMDPLSKSTIRSERYTRWLMAATLVSAIVCTAWIAWSIRELHNFALQQANSVKDSIEIARYGILAANRRAEATEKTYDLAAETSRSQLRAYVSVLGISTQNAFEKNMSSSLNYKNVGQTPALGIRALTDVVIIPSSGSDVKPPRTYSTSYGGDNESTIALGGGIVASDPVSNRAFKDAELEEFRAGSKLYVVWGAIYYSDVFGKNHYTRFCRYFKNGDPGRWTLCQAGNDSN